MNDMHDEPFVESQLEVHVEPMIEEDEQPSFGSTIDEEQIDAQTTNRVILFADTCHQEMLEPDMIDLQEVVRLEELGVSN